MKCSIVDPNELIPSQLKTGENECDLITPMMRVNNDEQYETSASFLFPQLPSLLT